MNSKISVIVPVYKTPIIRLRSCIESILNQSYKNLELILIDDGNDSSYRKIFNEYAEQDQRIHIILQENSGVSTARNNGMKHAIGEYIVFCDSDDYMDGDFLEVMYSNLLGYDLVICGICEQYYPSNDSSVDMKLFFSIPTQYNWTQYVNFIHNKIFKKSIIDKNNITFDSKIRLGEDAIFVCEYLKHCKHIRCVKNEMYHYVWNADSAVNTYNEKFWEWEEKVITCQYEMFTQYPLNQDESAFMQRWLYVKMKGCLSYYFKQEINKEIKQKYLKKIMESKYFEDIFTNCRKNKFLSKADKLILLAWKYLGANGVRLSFWYSAYRRRWHV